MQTLLAALSAALMLVACAAAPSPSSVAMAFGVMGDTPYWTGEITPLDEMIDRINSEDLAFVVHIGDITSGRGPCSDEWFLARKAQFNRIRHPFVLIPGDNDWVDCHRSGMDPLERLARFRELFLAGDESLGGRRMKIERQSTDPRFSAYREHMRWLAGSVLFITLNVQGSNDNLGRLAIMDAERLKRAAAVRAWLNEAEKMVTQGQLSGLVILAQANPRFEESGARPRRQDGYVGLRNALRSLSIRLKKPILFVHGDTHRYQQNRPLKDAGGNTLQNFTRAEVYGSPFMGWLRGVIHPGSEMPVTIAPAH